MMIERNIKTVIVTGPTGAVGTALCSRLLQAGCTVVAVCRPGSPRAVALPKDANLYVVACDAANLADLPQCMAAAGLPVQADAFSTWRGRTPLPRAAMICRLRLRISAIPLMPCAPRRQWAAVCLLVPAARQSMAVWTVFCGPIPPQTPKTGTAWPSCVQAR